MAAQPPYSVLFVCLGNICRSPLAEGVLRAIVDERLPGSDIVIESAGTGAWHAGSAPDPRSIEIARRHGIDIAAQRARKVQARDFSDFDLILGMDASNVESLRRIAPKAALPRLHLFTEFATGTARDVPDPYYGGPDGFDNVYRMVREAAEMLVSKLAEPRAVSPVSGQASSTI